MSDSTYARDLAGYSGKPPVVRWPDGARVAVQFVLNIEEGSENCILHGDSASTPEVDPAPLMLPHYGMHTAPDEHRKDHVGGKSTISDEHIAWTQPMKQPVGGARLMRSMR